MELRDYVRILRKNWILILVTTLVGGSVAAGVSSTITPRYSATAELYVSVRQGSEDGLSGLIDGTNFARQAVASYVSIVNSATVLEPVVDELNLDMSARQLASMVTASSPLNTVLLEVTVTGTDPAEIATIANAVSRNFIDFVENTLEKPDSDSLSTVNIELVQPAMTATAPINQNTRQNVIVGVLLGLAIGLALSLVRALIDTRVHSTRDIEEATGKPVLGGIAFDPEASKRPLVVHVDPQSPRAESFRRLRTNLQFLNVDDIPRSVVITSSVSGEGKSTTAANIAISLADTGMRVALVDGDLRVPKIAGYMGIEGGAGLSDVLINRADLADVLQKWGRGELYVLPSGQIPPNPSELLGSARMAKILETLAAQFDYVVLDAPPLLLATDAAVLSKLAGGAILVVAAGRTKKAEIVGAVRSLDQVGSRTLGVVATMLPVKGPDAKSYGTYAYGDAHVPSDAEETNDGARETRAGRGK